MPEPIATPGQQAIMEAIKDNVSEIVTISSGKTGAYYSPEIPEPEHESFWHPVKAIQDLIGAIKENTRQTNLLLKQIEMERDFIDVPSLLGLTIGFFADYQQRKYIYANTSATGVTLVYGVNVVVPLTVGKWINISPYRNAMEIGRAHV